MTTVGIVGGTGPAGRGVATRLLAAGHDVWLGSRDAQRAASVAGEIDERIRGLANEQAAGAEIVVVATPWDSALATVRALRESLSGKLVISMVNALTKDAREMLPLYPPRGAMAAQIAAALPESHVVGAFHHLPASLMQDLASEMQADVVIVGDDAAARERVLELVDSMPGLRGVIAGSLSLASAVEAFTAVCISINIRHKAHSYVTLAGLSE